jgi:CRISPR-associated endoribonuclease Cas6
MRLKLKYSENTETVPNNISIVNSFIHKCLGNNNKYHDTISNYCITRMMGGEVVDGGRNINYKNGGYIIVTSTDMVFIDKLVEGVMINDFGYGMKLLDVEYITENLYDGYNFFKTTDTGFILKKKDGTGFHTIKDPDFIDVLKNHLMTKVLKIKPKADLTGFNVEIENLSKAKVRRIFVKNTPNLSNVCQLKIIGNRDVIETIYNNGIGKSTGSGFGTIYKTENHKKWYV